MPLYKIWSVDRENKSFFFVKEDESLYEQLILKASLKFGIDGERLVLEEDGTLCDDDQALALLSEKTFIILQKNETWIPSNMSLISVNDKKLTTLSGTSTDTITSSENFFHDIGVDEETDLEIIKSGNSNNRAIQNHLPNNRNTEIMWETYDIPWNLISPEMKTVCERGKRDKHIITAIVHTIMDDMKTLKDNIPYSAFRTVARKIIERYPDMFMDRDEDGTILGNGLLVLSSKLHERYTYLNRPHKRKAGVMSPKFSTKYINTVINSRAGCSNWQPEMETCDLELSNKPLEHIYAEQRVFLNNLENPPGLSEIKNTYPDLLEKENIFAHFEKLTTVNIKDTMQHIKLKSEKILQFGIQKKFISTCAIAQEHIYLKCLEIYSKYFNENIEDFHYTVKNFDCVTAKIPSPSLINLENDNETRIYICMENEILHVPYDNFSEAFVAALCLYFNFNLQYPKSFCYTLEMVQRYHFKLHPDAGGKSKKISTTKKRVFSLIRSLSSF